MISRSMILAAVLTTTWMVAASPAAAQLTSEQDRRQMMERLGITSLRPGPSGDETAPDHANYDPSRADPFPDYPDPLRMVDGTPVTNVPQWWSKRRPEIVEAFEREVYGRIPANVPQVTWSEVASENEIFVLAGGFKGVKATKVVGHVDSVAPDIDVNLRAMLILPQGAKNVPVLVMFGPADFPAPTGPQGADLERVNKALREAMIARDPGLKPILDRHPGYMVARSTGILPAPPESRLQDLLAAGWGVMLLDPASIQPDDGAMLRQGIIGLTNKGAPRKPTDWGVLRAWGWGASKGLEYLQTRPEVDPTRIGVEGVSRYGKAALVAAAFDPRFAAVLVGSSGKGGVTPFRRNWGEAVENLTGSGSYHWMAGNFLKYGGPKNAGDLPVDSPELLALVAPRLAFISYGVPAQGDARWLDQQGSYMATVGAGRVWKLLGAKDLGVGNDYKTAKMPPPLTSLTDGQLSWRQHEGGHTDAPNMNAFIQWAVRNMQRGPASK
ncbi:hypothetical protein [Sphingomonas sp. 3-13AW]|uniref:alpha/beta hydrolase family protein n=1 Tax=Sphingomonas sp. 3-13AW TaxID=3050450 RepID=UPI003BB5DE85